MRFFRKLAACVVFSHVNYLYGTQISPRIYFSSFISSLNLKSGMKLFHYRLIIKYVQLNYDYLMLTSKFCYCHQNKTIANHHYKLDQHERDTKEDAFRG